MKVEDIKTGYIGLTSGTTPLSRAIQWFQKKNNKKWGDMSHALVFRWIDGVLYANEAQAFGITDNNYIKRYCNSKYKKLLIVEPTFELVENDVITITDLFTNDKMKWWKIWMLRTRKTTYDIYDTFIAQPVKILTKGKVWIGEKKQDNKDFNCSEYACTIWNILYELQGNKEKYFENDFKMSPSDIASDKRLTIHELEY